MIKQGIQIFGALILVILVAKYPWAVINGLEGVVNAAEKIAESIANSLRTNGG
jgi:hypothetical protein